MRPLGPLVWWGATPLMLRCYGALRSSHCCEGFGEGLMGQGRFVLSLEAQLGLTDRQGVDWEWTEGVSWQGSMLTTTLSTWGTGLQKLQTRKG